MKKLKFLGLVLIGLLFLISCIACENKDNDDDDNIITKKIINLTDLTVNYFVSKPNIYPIQLYLYKPSSWINTEQNNSLPYKYNFSAIAQYNEELLYKKIPFKPFHKQIGVSGYTTDYIQYTEFNDYKENGKYILFINNYAGNYLYTNGKDLEELGITSFEDLMDVSKIPTFNITNDGNSDLIGDSDDTVYIDISIDDFRLITFCIGKFLNPLHGAFLITPCDENCLNSPEKVIETINTINNQP